MSNKKVLCWNGLSLVFLLSCLQIGLAHQPDLSNLMIYEQNGKSILLIKSSLNAFQGEIDYIYAKDAYKTPQEFQELVIKHFQKNCLLILNEDTIKFVNPYLVLGHETTLFAELSNKPEAIKSFYLKNAMFKDIPSNLCEVILTMKNLPQKQFILGNDVNHGLKLNVENGKWIVEARGNDFFNNPIFIFLSTFLTIGLLVAVVSVVQNNHITHLLLRNPR